MTRQKKELIKKIEAVQFEIWAEEKLGCGFTPAGAFAPYYKKIDKYEEELAHLRGYSSVMDMYMDTRYIAADMPF